MRRDYCTVSRGIVSVLVFRRSGTTASLDGAETWKIYRRGDTDLTTTDNYNLLVRRLSGTWTLFMTDGTERRFATVCDSCGTPDAYCVDPRQGGVARLVDVFDPRGNGVHISYDRPMGVLIALSDDLDHSLELRSPDACTEGLARELRYDGQSYATYAYDGVDLTDAVDVDGKDLRHYEYLPGGLLDAVVNESGDVIAEFDYDADGNATAVIDGQSDVTVQYGADRQATVVERYGEGLSSTSQRTLDQDGNVTSISDGCSCGPATTRTWSNRRLVCETDAHGQVTYRSYDAYGRVTYRVEYLADNRVTCPPAAPNLPSSNSSIEEWTDYAVVKEIASEVSLPLDHLTTTRRRSVIADPASHEQSETLDYDPVRKTDDPPDVLVYRSAASGGSGCVSADRQRRHPSRRDFDRCRGTARDLLFVRRAGSADTHGRARQSGPSGKRRR